jgi:hypothetical protein
MQFWLHVSALGCWSCFQFVGCVELGWSSRLAGLFNASACSAAQLPAGSSGSIIQRVHETQLRSKYSTAVACYWCMDSRGVGVFVLNPNLMHAVSSAGQTCPVCCSVPDVGSPTHMMHTHCQNVSVSVASSGVCSLQTWHCSHKITCYGTVHKNCSPI